MTITKVEYQSARPHIKQVDGFPDFIHKVEFTYLAHKTIATTTAEGVAYMTQQMLSTCTYSDPSTSDYDSSNPYIGVSSFTQSKVSGMFSVAYADNQIAWDKQINENIIWPNHRNKLNNYDSLLTINQTEYKMKVLNLTKNKK